MTLNQQATQVHAANARWWTNINTGLPIQRNKGELLMLAITELAEMVEGIRKNLMDDHLPHRKMEEVEAADFKIRLLDYAGGFKLNLLDDPEQFDLCLLKNKGEQLLWISSFVFDIYEAGRDPGVSVSEAIGVIEEYCRIHNLDLEGAIKEKLAYNRTRKDHSHEERLKPNGKKI